MPPYSGCDIRRSPILVVQVFQPPNAAVGSKADLTARESDFRFLPESGLRADIASYSIISSSLSSLDPTDNRIVVYNHEASQDTENQLQQIGHQDASLRRPLAASTPNRIFGTHR
jgi:hypothetical protein